MELPGIDAAAGGERAKWNALIRLCQYTLGAVTVPLSDAAEVIEGKPVSAGTMPKGRIPLIQTGTGATCYVDRSNHTGELITVATRGDYAGFPAYWNEPVFIAKALALEGRKEIALTKYLYYLLDARRYALNQRKTEQLISTLSGETVLSTMITLPPLSEQERLVALLDSISGEEDRRVTTLYIEKQYEGLRDRLMAMKKEDKRKQ